MRQIPINRMALKKLLLFPARILHRDIRHDILLTAIDDADKAELEGVRPASEDIERIRARVHEVEFCQDAQCPQPAWVDGPGKLERVGIGEVDVGGGDGKDDAGDQLGLWG